MLLLNISQQYAKISMTTKPPQIQLQIQPPVLNIHTEAAKVEIHSPQGRLEIDNTEMRASYGVKTRDQMIRDEAERGKQAAQAFTEKTAADGDDLANFAKSGVSTTSLAAQASVTPAKEVGWNWLAAPEIHYEAQPVEFQVQSGKIDFDPTMGKVDNTLDWGRVDIGISQYQSVKFWTTEDRYATMSVDA